MCTRNVPNVSRQQRVARVLAVEGEGKQQEETGEDCQGSDSGDRRH